MNRLDKGSSLVLGWGIAMVCLLVGAYLRNFLEFPLGYIYYILGFRESLPVLDIPHIVPFLKRIVFEYDIVAYTILGIVSGTVICLFHPDYGMKPSSSYRRILWVTIFTFLGILFLLQVVIGVLIPDLPLSLLAKRMLSILLSLIIVDFTFLSVSLWGASWLYPKAYELAMRYFD